MELHLLEDSPILIIDLFHLVVLCLELGRHGRHSALQTMNPEFELIYLILFFRGCPQKHFALFSGHFLLLDRCLSVYSSQFCLLVCLLGESANLIRMFVLETVDDLLFLVNDLSQFSQLLIVLKVGVLEVSPEFFHSQGLLLLAGIQFLLEPFSLQPGLFPVGFGLSELPQDLLVLLLADCRLAQSQHASVPLRQLSLFPFELVPQ